MDSAPPEVMSAGEVAKRLRGAGVLDGFRKAIDTEVASGGGERLAIKVDSRARVAVKAYVPLMRHDKTHMLDAVRAAVFDQGLCDDIDGEVKAALRSIDPLMRRRVAEAAAECRQQGSQDGQGT